MCVFILILFHNLDDSTISQHVQKMQGEGGCGAPPMSTSFSFNAKIKGNLVHLDVGFLILLHT